MRAFIFYSIYWMVVDGAVFLITPFLFVFSLLAHIFPLSMHNNHYNEYKILPSLGSWWLMSDIRSPCRLSLAVVILRNIEQHVNMAPCLMNMHIGEHPSALIYYRFYLHLYDLFEQKMLSIDNHHSQSSPALVAITTHIHILTLNLNTFSVYFFFKNNPIYIERSR